MILQKKDNFYLLKILADKFFCIIESSICVPTDLGSKATLTPVPNIPFEETPTQPVRKNIKIKIVKVYFFHF